MYKGAQWVGMAESDMTEQLNNNIQNASNIQHEIKIIKY